MNGPGAIRKQTTEPSYGANAATDRLAPSGMLHEILQRTAELKHRIQDMTGNVGELGDRVFGVQPELEGNMRDAPSAVSNGMYETIIHELYETEMAMTRLEGNFSRLRPLA